MESTAQEQLLSSLRHTLLDLARRLQQDTVSEDVADYVLFRLENEKKKTNVDLFNFLTSLLSQFDELEADSPARTISF